MNADIATILNRTRTVAMIGASPDTHRPSNSVMHFLQSRGYRVIPVNPVAAGGRIHGETVVATLADIPADAGPVDMVEIFRRADQAGESVDQAIAEMGRLGITAVWMQLGVIDEAAAARAEGAGLDVVMDRCPAIEIPRLRL